MSDFSKAIPYILKHEGVYSDNPNDPGGPTIYGISLRFLKGLGADGDINHDGAIDVKDIKALTLPDAMKLYYDSFWLPAHYEKISNQSIATKMLDMSVNMGPGVAAKIMQRAVNSLIVERSKLAEDGALGPKSFDAINSLGAIELMGAIIKQALNFYALIVSKDPKKKEFLKGWINRANAKCGL